MIVDSGGYDFSRIVSVEAYIMKSRKLFLEAECVIDERDTLGSICIIFINIDNVLLEVFASEVVLEVLREF